MTRRIAPSVALAAIALTTTFATPRVGDVASDVASDRASKKLFQTCLGCHHTPLLELATDRAWLNAVRDTT